MTATSTDASAVGLRDGLLRITAGLHAALQQLQLDTRLTRLAGDDLPDAAARLDHVVRLTEQAAHRTLDLVEQSRSVAAQIEAEAGRTEDSELFRKRVARDAGRLRENLTQIALAQDYQDLTGQIIRKVVGLVARLETALTDLLKAAGCEPQGVSEVAVGLAGPVVPGTRDAGASQSEADDLMLRLGL